MFSLAIVFDIQNCDRGGTINNDKDFAHMKGCLVNSKYSYKKNLNNIVAI